MYIGCERAQRTHTEADQVFHRYNSSNKFEYESEVMCSSDRCQPFTGHQPQGQHWSAKMKTPETQILKMAVTDK